MRIQALNRQSGVIHLIVLSVVCFSLVVAKPAGTQSSVRASSSLATQSADSGQRPWMNTALSAEERANLLIHEMTLDEKITMMHGANPMKGNEVVGYDFELPPKGYVGYVPANRSLGIPGLTLADGRAGVGN